MKLQATCECKSLAQRLQEAGDELRESIIQYPAWIIPQRDINLGLTAEEEKGAIEVIRVEEERALWLSDMGRKEKDVMQDEDGEYVMAEPVLMDEGEPEDGRYQKVYLPTEIQYI